MTDELVAWLREQVDEDERKAQLVHGRCGNQVVVDLPEYVDEETTLHRKVVVFDPARVLAEVAAKRRIIGRCAEQVPASWAFMDDVFHARAADALETLRLLASMYAGRPGWRSEWAPDEEVSHG